MEHSIIPLEVIEKYILPTLLWERWTLTIKPALEVGLVCKQLHSLLLGDGALERKKAIWLRVLDGSRREIQYGAMENRQRMSIPMKLIQSLCSKTQTYQSFPKILVKEKGMMFVLKSKFRKHWPGRIGPVRSLTPMLLCEAECEKPNTPGIPCVQSGMGCYVDARGRYGEGELDYALMTCRNWMGMRMYIANCKLKRGLMVLPGGTLVEGKMGNELLEGSRTYSNGIVTGKWSLKVDEEKEVYEYTKLEDGELVLYGDGTKARKVYTLPKEIELSGIFDSPNPLDRECNDDPGPIMNGVDLDGKKKKVFCNNRKNVIVVSDVEE